MPAPPIGKTWPSHPYEVGLEKVREYAYAIGESAALSHDREAAREAGLRDVAAPPTFAAVFCAPAVAAAIFDPEVGLFDPEVGLASYRFVHRAQRFEWHRPVLVGDLVTTSVRLAAAEQGDDGRLTRVFESESVDAEGEPILTARYEGVVPGSSRGRGARQHEAPLEPAPAAADPASPTPGRALPELRLIPDRYAPARYAGASGDFTPFHLDREAALAIGLPGVILHGLYTFAQAARAHTSPFGDPRVLRCLSARFRRPAVPERELVVVTNVTAATPEGALLTRGEARQGERTVLGDVQGRLVPPASG